MLSSLNKRNSVMSHLNYLQMRSCLSRNFCKHVFLGQKSNPLCSNTSKTYFQQAQKIESLFKSSEISHGLLLPSNLVHTREIKKSLTSDSHQNSVKESLLKLLCSKNRSDDTVTIIDMTYGDGHHTKLILENIENVKLICLDRDKESFEKAKSLSERDSRVVPVFGKFSDLPAFLNSMDYPFKSIDIVMLDVGISESQATSLRGFSPNSNAPLDMRMDTDGVTAAQVLSAIEEFSLSKVFKVYGEEKHSKKLARAIIETRYTFKKLERTSDLNELVFAVLGTDVRVDSQKNKMQHVAQKVYNGLRRFVNNELNELNYAMLIAEKYVKSGGIVVTKCNSIVEDRVVKRHLTGNVVENCANDLALKFVNHNMTVGSKEMMKLTYSPWNVLDKTISPDGDLKLRVAMKK